MDPSDIHKVKCSEAGIDSLTGAAAASARQVDRFPQAEEAVLQDLRATVWIDVTTILRWNRPVVGVVRVEERLARYVLDQQFAPLRFCRFDAERKAFLTVARETVAERIAFYDQMARSDAVNPEVTDPAGGARPRRRNTLLKRMRKSARKLVRGCRRRLGLAADREHVAWTAHGAAPHAAPSHLSGATPVSFARFALGDVYVSVGSDWDDKDLQSLHSLKKASGISVLGICYDTIPIKYPHLTMESTARTFPRYLADLGWVADHIMCISRCTQRDLLDYFDSVGVPAPATSVLTLGGDLSRPDPAQATVTVAGGETTESPGPGAVSSAVLAASNRPFVLFVSTIERRKNHETLYKAWVRLIDTGCAVPDLVFVGMKGWGVSDLLADISRDPRTNKRIHILSEVSDLELRFLYERCEYTVYPSLYEGWGLPVVESLAYGKFCLCSDAGSLREAGGGLIEHLDPWDINAWVSRIRYYTEHPVEIRERNRRIAETFRPSPWRTTSLTLLRQAVDLSRTRDRSP